MRKAAGCVILDDDEKLTKEQLARRDQLESEQDSRLRQHDVELAELDADTQCAVLQPLIDSAAARSQQGYQSVEDVHQCQS